MTALDLDAIERAAREATPGKWESNSEPTYMPQGKVDTYGVFNTAGRKIVDTLNCDFLISEINEECDDDGIHRWDEGARKNALHIATSCPSTVLAMVARMRELEAHLEAIDRDATHWIVDMASTAIGSDGFVEGYLNGVVSAAGSTRRLILQLEPDFHKRIAERNARLLDEAGAGTPQNTTRAEE